VKARRARTLENANKLGCNCVAAFEPENVFYLTGFWGEAVAICKADSTQLIAPKLEYTRAVKTSIDCEVIATDRGRELVSTVVSTLAGSKTCTDCNDQTIIESMQKEGSRLTMDREPFFGARRIKDEKEVRVIGRASRILDKLYAICEEEICVGMTERELQAKIVYEGMQRGANPPSYKSTLNPLIIGSGPNGALPHAEVTERAFKKGDLVVVDLTLRHEGYIGDATRTFSVTSISKEAEKVYDLVRQSQRAGLAAAVAGTSCASVDFACRKVIADAGYGQEFVHSTGHGIGLDVHEPPWVRSNNNEMLTEGMAITIEPGIYLQNKFGVRIEDSIIVRNGRPAVLNKFTKDLIIVK
jgi:Xaa-Pro aminopeptidase/Xaa-Pro dipeptidase